MTYSWLTSSYKATRLQPISNLASSQKTRDTYRQTSSKSKFVVYDMVIHFRMVDCYKGLFISLICPVRLASQKPFAPRWHTVCDQQLMQKKKNDFFFYDDICSKFTGLRLHILDMKKRVRRILVRRSYQKRIPYLRYDTRL